MFEAIYGRLKDEIRDDRQFVAVQNELAKYILYSTNRKELSSQSNKILWQEQMET